MIPIFYSDDFLEHQTGAYHPESPGRLTAVKQHLSSLPWAPQLDWRSPTPLDQQEARLDHALRAVHPSDHVALIQQLSKQGGGHIDADTPVSPRSYDVARLAVNAWLDGVETVLQTQRPAFALVRPPGHHATAIQAMGFCLFSNAAIAALYALKQPGVERVAILDWDVHHGNGTQAIVELHPEIRYCSLHESPNYPGTGAATDTGRFNNVLNLPMTAGSMLSDYETVMQRQVIPFLEGDRPDILIISAGYDANKADPLSGIALQPQDFGQFTQYCLNITSTILFGLEGGYDFTALAHSVAATLEPCLSL